MKAVLKLPRVSMNMEEATITQWHKKPGDTFVEGDALYAIETEKSATDIEAPAAGTLLEILAPEGSNIEAGTPVCSIDVMQSIERG